MPDQPTTPPTSQQLDEIEAPAEAATPGPWSTYQYGGDSLIEIAADLEDTGCGYRARRTICRFDEEPLDNDPTHREWTAEEDWAQVQADAAYIGVMSPDTTRALVDEIRRLRALPELLEAVLTERFTETENPYARMVWHEEAPDGYPSTHAVSPVKVAATLRELISPAAVPVVSVTGEGTA